MFLKVTKFGEKKINERQMLPEVLAKLAQVKCKTYEITQKSQQKDNQRKQVPPQLHN